MTQIDPGIVRHAIEALVSERTTDEIRQELAVAYGDPILAERLTTWVCEAFGRLIVGKQPGVHLVDQFLAESGTGDWKQLPISKAPIYAMAFREAEMMLRADDSERYQRVADRSAIMQAASKAMQAGESLNGSTF